ncbi:hypothetical protein B0H12DRAFT_1070634 [Mycena haematopus]|nr:hypothetical protein B0H12DRAFT_1070634 [Mycena haematopus]
MMRHCLGNPDVPVIRASGKNDGRRSHRNVWGISYSNTAHGVTSRFPDFALRMLQNFSDYSKSVQQAMPFEPKARSFRSVAATQPTSAVTLSTEKFRRFNVPRRRKPLAAGWSTQHTAIVSAPYDRLATPGGFGMRPSTTFDPSTHSDWVRFEPLGESASVVSGSFVAYLRMRIRPTDDRKNVDLEFGGVLILI